ncbi:nitrate- and nitrite sensing domain-containing protein [Spirillospora sp. NPDC052242]
MALPLIALLSLWAFAAVTTASAALERYDYSTMYKRVGLPVSVVNEAVQSERATAASFVGKRTGAGLRRFQEQARRTDAALGAFRESAFSQDAQRALDSETKQRLRSIDQAFSGMEALRSRIGSGAVSSLQVIEGYDQITETTIPLLGMMVDVDDIGVFQQSRALIDAYWAQEFILREGALMASAGTAGRLTDGEYTAFVAWSGARAQALAEARAGSSGAVADILAGLESSPQHTAFLRLEADVVQRRSVADPAQWRAATEALSKTWLHASQQAAAVVDRDQVQPVAQRITVRFLVVCVAGLLVVVVAVLSSTLLARSLAAELGKLRHTARHMAQERLPQVVGKLRRGERVDVKAETPPPVFGRTQEIVEVAEAFAAVQLTAITTAVGEAELRGGINQVFVNLSWRSQSLLHRQLRLLDAMERKASSPEELEDLFRLDHLTTRMRRHAEGLVILSGAPTVRAWEHPVAAEDVARAAIAEVEDYTRVDVVGSSPAALSGDVVADVIHLLAELIENATTFSPPGTEVTVKIESVAAGLAVEIVDRGVGIHPLQRTALNERLAQPVDFDLADTDRLGLFVVARLAARHGVKVSLEPSPYGGTTAIVLIPGKLTSAVAEEGAATATVAVGGEHGPPATAGAAPAKGVTPPQRLGRPYRSGGPAQAAEASNPVPSQAAVARTVEPEAHADQTSETTGVLPRRVRQSHMAPQLRRSAGGAHARREAEPDDDEADADLNRGVMSALQSGWRQGGEDDVSDPNNGWEEA